MSDWMGSEITLWAGSILAGILAGRLCARGASWLPVVLEHQWRQDARDLLGLTLEGDLELRQPNPSRSVTWLAQIGCAALSFTVAVNLGATLEAMLALLLTWCLLVLSLIDLEHYLLPDVLVLPGLWAGLVINSFGVFTTLDDAFWGCVVGYVSLWSASQLSRLITGRECIGRGDLKLLALMGAWGGIQVFCWTLVCSLLGAALTTIFLKLLGKISSTTHIPLGPFLSVAGWTAFLSLAH